MKKHFIISIGQYTGRMRSTGVEVSKEWCPPPIPGPFPNLYIFVDNKAHFHSGQLYLRQEVMFLHTCVFLWQPLLLLPILVKTKRQLLLLPLPTISSFQTLRVTYAVPMKCYMFVFCCDMAEVIYEIFIFPLFLCRHM